MNVIASSRPVPFSDMPRRRVLRGLLALFICSLFLIPIALAGEVDSLLGPAPGTYKLQSEDGIAAIPFELFRGDIRMNGTVNGRPVRMMIDNGFLWDDLLFFGSPRVDSLGFVYEEQLMVGGSGDGEEVSSDYATGITIGFPGVEFYDQTAIVTPYSSGISNMWWGTEGQVSATFLKHFVVDINFDTMTLTLIEPDRFVYEGKGTAVPLMPNGDGSWSVPATVVFTDGRSVSFNLALDLGLGDALHLVVGGEHEFARPEKSLPASLGFGIQGEIRGHIGRVASLQIGGFRLDDVITGFVSGDSKQHANHETWLGMDVFSRFNIVFDYPRRTMYLEPNRRFNEPFEYNMTGMVSRKGQGQFREIITIHPDSPASEAGLMVGDKIIDINGRSATAYDVWELIALFSQAGKSIALTLQRGDKQLELTLPLRRII